MVKDKNWDNLFFSILMANYNNEKYIEEAISSVLSQTYPHWELIIVDDNSTDTSINIIQPYLKDNRIKLVKNDKNLGYGGTLITAINHSTKDIICILDSDDKITENALELIVKEYIKHPDVGFIYSTMWECDSELIPIRICPWIGPDNPPKTNLIKTRVSHVKTFFKKIYLKTSGFSSILRIAVDRDIIFKMEEKTNFFFLNKPLYFYRIHPTGVSQGNKQFQSRVELYITKCMAYRRRLNTSLPNVKLLSLYIEYFKITFQNIIIFIRKLIRICKIRFIIEILSRKFKIIKILMQKSIILNKLIYQN